MGMEADRRQNRRSDHDGSLMTDGNESSVIMHSRSQPCGAGSSSKTILRTGVEKRNGWRKDHYFVCHLTEANLNGAKLKEADFTGANLSRATLSGADLTGANLSRVNFFGANLNGANLKQVDLTGANLMDSNLSETNFEECGIGHSIYANNDLSTAKGLEAILHLSPSSIGVERIAEGDDGSPVGQRENQSDREQRELAQVGPHSVGRFRGHPCLDLHRLQWQRPGG